MLELFSFFDSEVMAARTVGGLKVHVDTRTGLTQATTPTTCRALPFRELLLNGTQTPSDEEA